jgi:hypothetical protein
MPALRLILHTLALPLAIGGAGILLLAARLDGPVSTRTLVLCPAAIVLGIAANHLWRPRKPEESRGFDVV